MKKRKSIQNSKKKANSKLKEEEKKVNWKLDQLTYPALASGVQHNGGMVLGDQLRHKDGGEAWRNIYWLEV